MNKIGFLLTLLLLTTKSFGCICWFGTDKKSVKEKIEKADIIIYGTAVADDLADGENMDSIRHITDIVFKVDHVWKGKKIEKLKFDPKKRPCEDAHYKIGERYIVFGYINQETGQFEANICTSLSEETKPDAIDQKKITKEFDLKKYEQAMTDMRQEFLSVKKLIIRKTKQNNG
jgi:plasmid replication initiation protein